MNLKYTVILRLIVFLMTISPLKAHEYSSTAHEEHPDCVFCNPSIIKKQSFYEDELAISLVTYKPILPGHCLIIPKRHVERFEDLTPDEMVAIYKQIKRIHMATELLYGHTDYIILQKNGVNAGQTVFHVHFHYIPSSQTIEPDFLKSLYKHVRAFVSPHFSEVRTMSDKGIEWEVKKMQHAFKEVDTLERVKLTTKMNASYQNNKTEKTHQDFRRKGWKS